MLGSYPVKTATGLLTLAVILSTGTVIFLFPSEHASIIVTMIGTFWGFFLSQTGLMLYERYKEREELISMFVSARHELYMNKGTLVWIDHLIDQKLSEQAIHGLGFSGVDEISVAAVENLVRSSLIHKFASRRFTSDTLLRVYQTMLVIKREIPTDQVDGRNPDKYSGIHFDKVIDAIDLLAQWLDQEATALCGTQKWSNLVGSRLDPRDHLQQMKAATNSTVTTAPPSAKNGGGTTTPEPQDSTERGVGGVPGPRSSSNPETVLLTQLLGIE
jgi:hypothetical protein